MSGNDRVFVFIIGAGLVMGLATTVADCERRKIESADAYTAGYARAADSINSTPRTAAIDMLRLLDANGLRYTVLVQRADSVVAQINGGGTR